MITLKRSLSIALITTMVGGLVACGGSSNSSSSGSGSVATAAASIDLQSKPWPGGWIWKPRSEGTGTLVVLPPFSTSAPFSIHRADGVQVGSVIRRGSHSGKSTIYFNRSGANYPNPSYLKYKTTYYKVTNPSRRRG